MRLVLQRVKSARVELDGQVLASIGCGILALVGFGREDEQAGTTSDVLPRMARKIIQTRMFPDQDDKMNLSLEETRGEILAVSQFTLHADCRKGRRPSLQQAADPQTARELFDSFVRCLRQNHPSGVRTGVFGAHMEIVLRNWGPLTFFWDSHILWGEAQTVGTSAPAMQPSARSFP